MAPSGRWELADAPGGATTVTVVMSPAMRRIALASNPESVGYDTFAGISVVLPQRLLIAYGTKHDGLDPFRQRVPGHHLDQSTPSRDRHAPYFSGRSS